jgi:hypothetical protein
MYISIAQPDAGVRGSNEPSSRRVSAIAIAANAPSGDEQGTPIAAAE